MILATGGENGKDMARIDEAIKVIIILRSGVYSLVIFPVLANYRRNGYDFDSLFDDGMVSYQSKKIMDVFDLDENKPVRQKSLRPQQLPWPENLITEIGLEEVFGTDTYTPLNDDQLEGLDHALDLLKDKDKTAVILRYKEHKTFKETADHFSISTERARQIIRKCIRKLRHPDRMAYYKYGYQGLQERREERKRRLREEAKKNGLPEALSGVDIRECELSVRAYNCLHRAGMDTLGQVVESIDRDSWEILRIRNLGLKCLAEVLNKFEEYGIDCDSVREEAKNFYGDNNSVTKALYKR